MALGAKLKLGFADDSSPKPSIIYNDYQRWIQCDYMVTYWILNSMVAELSKSFLYAQSASDLWKELEERYDQSNGLLIYHVESELSKVSQGKKNKRENKMVAQNGKVYLDQRMVAIICKEMMKMFKGKDVDQCNGASTSKPHICT
uniref:Zinc finger, CCHC-type n=1 Tax=Tanacetum cinerariifolium TaxID=118510 RepID=A0A6L2JI69_TANCI|nr:hypothetical protein [Tanacetum cinerariifolium]